MVDFGRFCKHIFPKSANTQGNRHKRIKYMTNLYFDKFKILRKSVRIFLKGPRPAKPPYKPSLLHFPKEKVENNQPKTKLEK